MYFVYFIQNSHTKLVKIGVSKNIDNRLKALQTSNGSPLVLLGYVTKNIKKRAYGLEKLLHTHFENDRVLGEWFLPNLDYEKINGYEKISTMLFNSQQPNTLHVMSNFFDFDVEEMKEYLDRNPTPRYPLPSCA